MLQLNLNRTVTIDGDEFSVTFKFPYKEDLDVEALRSKIRGDEDDNEKVTHYVFRSAIVGVTGFIDLSGNDIKIEEPDMELKQKAIYEYLRANPDFIAKIISAYVNLAPKNLKTGKTL
jgi:hypothetical protein